MPKKPYPDKKTRARNSAPKSRFRQAPSSINELLLKKPSFKQLSERIPEQQSWTEWLRAALPPELGAHVVHVNPKAAGGAIGGMELIVSADSPSWCARLRFALAAIEGQITARDAAVQRTRVRVAMP
jgi:hypothetical protein